MSPVLIYLLDMLPWGALMSYNRIWIIRFSLLISFNTVLMRLGNLVLFQGMDMKPYIYSSSMASVPPALFIIYLTVGKLDHNESLWWVMTIPVVIGDIKNKGWISTMFYYIRRHETHALVITRFFVCLVILALTQFTNYHNVPLASRSRIWISHISLLTNFYATLMFLNEM